MTQNELMERELTNYAKAKEEYDETEAKFKKIRDAEEEILKNIRTPIKQEELKDGEYLCDLCKGMKAHFFNEELGSRCPACNGKGKTDWIENIYGKVNSYEW